VKVASEPEALLQVLTNPVYHFKRIGLEAGHARVIHNADTRLLDRNVQSGKMVHVALLLLMLEAAANADLVSTISQRRNTPNLLLSTSGPADYPIFRSRAAIVGGRGVANDPLQTNAM
jgi:hypothetical protein